MRKPLLVLALLFFPALAAAQGSFYQNIIISATGKPIAGANITVCIQGAVGAPCVPTQPIFADQAFTQPIANSTVISDSRGNYGFWILPGNYTYTVTGAGIQPYGPLPLSIPCMVNSACPGGGSLPNTALPFSPTLSLFATYNASYSTTLTGNTVVSVVGFPANGNLLRVQFQEDATGGRVPTWPANFVFATPYVFNLQPNALNTLTFAFDGTNWNQLDSNGSPAGTLPNTPVVFAPIITVATTPNASYSTTLTANLTLIVSGTPSNGNLLRFQLTEGGSGGYSVTFPGNFVVPAGFPVTSLGTVNYITFAFDGTNWNPLTAGSSAGAVGCSPGTTLGDFQMYGPGGTCVAASINQNPSTNQIDIKRNTSFLGPNPATYVTTPSIGARTINTNAWPQGNGTCTNGNTTFTFSALSANLFNGDGVFLPNCGPAETMTTPTIISVTPILESDGLNTGHSVNAPLGATTYCYSASLFDTAWGFTPASAQFCNTQGPASLGTQTIAITSQTRSTNVTTALVGSSSALAAGMKMHIAGTTDDPSFGGDIIVASVPDGTHFTYTNGMNAANGGSTSSTGGTGTYHQGMQIALTSCPASGFEYAVYGNTSGAQNFLQFSRPTCLALGTDPSAGIVQDWGSTVSGGTVTAPYWVPTTAPASAINDGLATTIASGCASACVGSGSLVLAVAPSNAGSPSSTITFDDGPLFVAADNFAKSTTTGGGYIYAPYQAIASGNSCYAISSYISISSDLVIGDPICDRSTLQTSGDISGVLAPNASRYANPSFALAPHIPIAANGYPGIWTTSGRLHNINVSSAGNNYLSVLSTNTHPIEIDHTNFSVVNQATDCVGTQLLIVGTFGGAFGGAITNDSFAPGPGTAAPGVCSAFALLTYQETELNINYHSMAERGFGFVVPIFGMGIHIYNGNEMQSCATPQYTFMRQESGIAGFAVNINHSELDTASCAIAANWSSSIGGLGGSGLIISSSGGPASSQPFVTGKPFPGLKVENSATSATASANQIGQNINSDISNSASGPSINGLANNFSISNPEIKNRDVIVAPLNSVFTNALQAAAPTVGIGTGGSIAVGTHSVDVHPVFPNGSANGAEGKSSFSASFTTTTGNQTANFSNYAVTGAIGYNFYVDGFLAAMGVCTSPQIKTLTASYVGGTCGNSETSQPGGGPASMANGVVAANQILPNLLDNTAYCDSQLGADAGLKANFGILNRLPGSGGTLDCTGPQGSQNISINLFNGLSSGGYLVKFGAIQATFTGTTAGTGTQKLPASTRMQGVGQGGPGYGSYFVAGASFPNSTPLFQMGLVAQDQGVQLRDFTVDCNNISGSIGIQNTLAQEQSLLDGITFKNCSGSAFSWTGSNAENAGPMRGLNCITGTAAGAATTCFTMSGLVSMRGLYDFTAAMNLNTTQPNVAVSIDGRARVGNGQVQLSKIGFEVGANAATNGVQIDNVTGTSLTTLIDISNLNAPQNIDIHNAQAASTTTLLNDNVTGCTYNGTALAHYGLLQNTGAGRFSIEGGLNVVNCLPTFGWGYQLFEGVPAFGAHSGYDIAYVDPTSHNFCLFNASSIATCYGSATFPNGVLNQQLVNNGTGANNYSAASPTLSVGNGGGAISLAGGNYTGQCDSAVVATGILDRGKWLVVTTGGANSVVIPDLSGSGCSGMYGGIFNNTASTITVIRQTSDTFVSSGPCSASSSTSITMFAGQTLTYSPDPVATSYDIRCGPATTSGHTVSSVRVCSDSSGSGTAQTCTTSPSFTPVTDDEIIYTTTTTNSGAGLTVNVNSLGAKSVAIPGNSGWTTTLTASTIPTNKPLILIYDGTNWNVQQTGVASSGGGTNIVYSTATTSSPTGGTTNAISTTTMVTPAANHVYRVQFIIDQTVATAGCGTQPTISISFLFKDAIEGGTTGFIQPPTLNGAGNNSNPISFTGSAGNLPAPWSAGPFTFSALSGTAVTYISTINVGSGCTTGATYVVQPILEQLL